MSNFFRAIFKPREWNTPGEGGVFGSFFSLVTGTGGGVYRVLLIISTLALLLGFGMAILRFIAASTGRPKDEAKAKVTQLMWIALALGAATGLIGFIFTVFSW